MAHPGHELRLHGWLEVARPRVLVLTDGSGARARSRLPSTSRLLAAAGATPGAVFGRLTDRALYAAILARDAALALGLVGELTTMIVRNGIDHVVADALEGYNPAHDLCHVLVSAAVELAARAGRRAVHLDFSLVGQPDARRSREGSVKLRLDDAALARKLAAARAYVGLGDEVETALAAQGVEAFRVECLRPVAPDALHALPPEDPPLYARHAPGRVAPRRYAHALRYREHFEPLAEAVRRRVLVEEPCAACAS